MSMVNAGVAAAIDGKYFPTPPKVIGYKPRKLTEIEQNIENSWNNPELVEDLLDGFIGCTARPRDVHRILGRAMKIADACYGRKYSPFAATDRLGRFLRTAKLIR